MDGKTMRQVAPWPDALAALVGELRYREHLGWSVRLEDDLQRDKPGRHAGESRGLTLVVERHGPDTYHPVDVEASARVLLRALDAGSPGQAAEAASKLQDALDALITVSHYFPVPPATYGRASWQRWLHDTLGKVDDHERMEDFTVAGERPFAPVHAPGHDPYVVREVASRADADTDFRGRRVHPDPGPEAQAAATLVRDVLEAVCRRDGVPLEGAADRGQPARNYELAGRLGIGHVFGQPRNPAPA